MPEYDEALVPVLRYGSKLNRGFAKAEIKARAQEKVEEIEEKMRDLQRMRDTLLKLIGSCEGTGTVEDCPILQAFDTGPFREEK
jgi:hypothetical protein